MKRAWLWATVALVVTAAGAACFGVLLLALWGPLSFVVTLPVCGLWGIGCALAGYRLARCRMEGGDS